MNGFEEDGPIKIATFYIVFSILILIAAVKLWIYLAQR